MFSRQRLTGTCLFLTSALVGACYVVGYTTNRFQPLGYASGTIETTRESLIRTDFVRQLGGCQWAASIDLAYHAKIAHIIINGENMTGNPHDTYDPSTVWSPDAVEIDASSVVFEVCSFGSWIVVRHGPYTTDGGSAWTESLIRLNLSAAGVVRRDDERLFLSAYSFGSMNSRNEVVSFPPIHQHHTHLYGSEWWCTDTVGLHGENQCAGSRGADCNTRVAPSEFRFMLNGPRISYYSAQLDVRSRRSTPLTTWAFLAMRVDDIGTTRILREAKIQVHPFPHSSRATYGLKNEVGEAVVWTSGRFSDFLPNGSTIWAAYSHFHTKAVFDAFLYQGSVGRVVGSAYSMPTQNVLEYRDGIVSEMLELLLRRQSAPDAAHLACSFRRDGVLEHHDGYATPFLRYSPCAISADEDQYVFIVLHKLSAVAYDGVKSPYKLKYLNMHSMVRVYYTGRIDDPPNAFSNDFPASESRTRLHG